MFIFFYYCISSHAILPRIFTYVNSFIPSLFSSPNNCKKIFFFNQSIKFFFSRFLYNSDVVFVHLSFRISSHSCSNSSPPTVTQKPNIFIVVSHKTSFKSDPGCNFLFSGFPVSSPSRETNKTKPNIYTDPSKRHALKREEKFNK